MKNIITLERLVEEIDPQKLDLTEDDIRDKYRCLIGDGLALSDLVFECMVRKLDNTMFLELFAPTEVMEKLACAAIHRVFRDLIHRETPIRADVLMFMIGFCEGKRDESKARQAFLSMDDHAKWAFDRKDESDQNLWRLYKIVNAAYLICKSKSKKNDLWLCVLEWCKAVAFDKCEESETQLSDMIQTLRDDEAREAQ